MRVALPASVSTAALARCDPARRVATLSGEALGTGWRVRYVVGAASAAALRAAIERRLADIVAAMSQWRPDSLLSRFNHAPAGSWHPLPPDFAAVVEAALTVAAASDGAFDPTHGRAAALLGHGAEPASRPPTIAELDAAHAAAGWRRLAYDAAARRLRQPGGLWLDLAGIAKGYAVDAVADVLAAAGVVDALIEIGGELVGRGLKPDGQPWWVDLETPPGVTLPRFRVALYEAAVATSGDYVRGAHTLDPRSGRPLDTVVTSVSVVAGTAMHADAWATALTVLGAERGLAAATEHGLAARIVTRERGGAVEQQSPALAAMIDD